MDEAEIQYLFSQLENEKVDLEILKSRLVNIIETIECVENYYQNEKLLRIYVLTTGKLFIKNGLTPWETAEKSICTAEQYLSYYPLNYEVNSIYLLLTNLTFKFDKSYQKAIELYRSNSKSLKALALQFLSLPDFYQEGLITKDEYEKYNIENNTPLDGK